MNLLELKQQVMFQIGRDSEDLGEFQPHLTDYLNEGYDLLMMAYRQEHVGRDASIPSLSSDKSSPELPGWMHRSLADYAAWMVCRNGNAQKQSQGYALRRAFDETLARARRERGAQRIHHIPR